MVQGNDVLMYLRPSHGTSPEKEGLGYNLQGMFSLLNCFPPANLSERNSISDRFVSYKQCDKHFDAHVVVFTMTKKNIFTA